MNLNKFWMAPTLVMSIAISGCDSIPNLTKPNESEKVIEEIDRVRDQHANQASQVINRQVMPPTPLSVPRNAPWLSKKVTAVYDSLPASLAIKAIAGEQPIRFAFSIIEDPLVRKTVIDSATSMEHLDSIASQANWVYSVENGVLTIRDIETKTIQLAIQPGTKDAIVGFRNLGSDISQSAGSDNSLELTIDPYDGELLEAIESVLGLGNATTGIDGGISQEPMVLDDGTVVEPQSSSQSNNATLVDPRTSVAILPSSNSLIVTARPDKMRTVERVVEQINRASSTLIRVDLTLYDVDVSDTDTKSLNLDFDSVTSANDLFGLSIVPTVDTINSSVASFEISGGRSSGTSAFYNWLKSKGDTSILLSDQVDVLNNHVGSVGDTQTREFVSNISDGSTTTDVLNTSTVPTIEKDIVRTGIELHIQPTAIHDKVLVSLSLSRSALIDEENFSFSDGAIAGTNLTTDDYNRTVSIELRDGVTRLITSQTARESINSQSRTPWLPWFGDSHSERFSERQAVMLMTATIINR